MIFSSKCYQYGYVYLAYYSKSLTWEKVFKNRPSKFWGTQPLKNFKDMVKKSTLEYFVSYVVWWVLHQISKSNVWSRCVFRAKSNISDGDFLQKIVDSFMAWTISAKKLFCRCLAGILIRFLDGTSRPEIFKKVLGTQIYKIRIDRFFL